MNDYMNVLEGTKVDDLVYDEKEETLQLSAKGVGVGNKVSIRDMLDDGIPVIELDSASGDNSNPDNNGCNCGCECEDNVVEFGDVGIVEKIEDDNVVEF